MLSSRPRKAVPSVAAAAAPAPAARLRPRRGRRRRTHTAEVDRRRPRHGAVHAPLSFTDGERAERRQRRPCTRHSHRCAGNRGRNARWRDRETIAATNGVTMISEMSQSGGAFTVKGDTYDVKVFGAGDNFLEINQDIKLEEGRFFIRGDKAVAIVGRNIAYPNDDDDQLVGVGDRINLVIRVRGEPKEMTLRVVGILEEHGMMFGLNVDDVVGIPFRTYDQLFEEGGSCAIVQAYIKDTEKINEVATYLKKKLGDDYFVVSPNIALKVQEQITGTIQAVLGGIAAISMFVAGIGIVNTMTISVNERTKEIGTLKAIGAKNRDILLLFLTEAFYTGIIGGTLGVVMGFVIGKIVGRYIGLYVEVSITLVIGTLVFSFYLHVLSLV